MKKELEDVIEILESAASDLSDRYVMTVTNMNGTHEQIVGRKEYLEFILDSTLNKLTLIQEELEGSI